LHAWRRTGRRSDRCRGCCQLEVRRAARTAAARPSALRTRGWQQCRTAATDRHWEAADGSRAASGRAEIVPRIAAIRRPSVAAFAIMGDCRDSHSCTPSATLVVGRQGVGLRECRGASAVASPLGSVGSQLCAQGAWHSKRHGGRLVHIPWNTTPDALGCYKLRVTSAYACILHSLRRCVARWQGAPPFGGGSHVGAQAAGRPIVGPVFSSPGSPRPGVARCMEGHLARGGHAHVVGAARRGGDTPRPAYP